MIVARIENGVVINIEVADQEWLNTLGTQIPNVTFVPCKDGCTIGWLYNYETETFSMP